MTYYQIKNYITNTPIFEGHFKTFSYCLEQAVADNVAMNYADLRHQDLSSANLDGAIITNSTFSGSNLMGANLSEANLSKSTFHNCDLQAACMSYSNLNQCDFRGALFGATLINDTHMENTKFSTLSCFDLDFFSVANMNGSTFCSGHDEIYEMSRSPIVIKGLLNTPVIILDKYIKIGSEVFSKAHLPQLTNVLAVYSAKISA